jgi:hypothetical protein
VAEPAAVVLPRDVQLIADLAEPIARGRADLLRGLFETRFPVGVRLKNAVDGEAGAQTDTEWLMATAPHGRGWQPVASWDALGPLARTAGRSGLTLLWPAETGDDAYGVHNGRDGVAWLIHLRRGEPPSVLPLARFRTPGHPPPIAAAVIDRCAEVRLSPADPADPC